jgi:serine protease SohB
MLENPYYYIIPAAIFGIYYSFKKNKANGQCDIVKYTDFTSNMQDKYKIFSKKKKAQEDNKKNYLYFKFDDLFENNNQERQLQNLSLLTQIMIKECDPQYVELILHIECCGGRAYLFEKAYIDIMNLKSNGFIVTALIDSYCASGGYMMALPCNKIVCSELAKIGSVGVIASLTNYHKLINKYGIEEKTFKTGDFKGNFPIGESYTDDDVKKMNENLNKTFEMFLGMVKKHRPVTEENLIEIKTAQIWYGNDAKNKNLVDEINSSYNYIKKLIDDNNIVYTIKQNNIGTAKSNTSIFNFIGIINDVFNNFFTQNNK